MPVPQRDRVSVSDCTFPPRSARATAKHWKQSSPSKIILKQDISYKCEIRDVSPGQSKRRSCDRASSAFGAFGNRPLQSLGKKWPVDGSPSSSNPPFLNFRSPPQRVRINCIRFSVPTHPVGGRPSPAFPRHRRRSGHRAHFRKFCYSYGTSPRCRV